MTGQRKKRHSRACLVLWLVRWVVVCSAAVAPAAVSVGQSRHDAQAKEGKQTGRVTNEDNTEGEVNRWQHTCLE